MLPGRIKTCVFIPNLAVITFYDQMGRQMLDAGADADAAAASLVVSIAIAALLPGLFFLTVGKIKLTGFMNWIPFPVCCMALPLPAVAVTLLCFGEHAPSSGIHGVHSGDRMPDDHERRQHGAEREGLSKDPFLAQALTDRSGYHRRWDHLLVGEVDEAEISDNANTADLPHRLRQCLCGAPAARSIVPRR
jgi:hypothetical protein